MVEIMQVLLLSNMVLLWLATLFLLRKIFGSEKARQLPSAVEEKELTPDEEEQKKKNEALGKDLQNLMSYDPYGGKQ